MRAEDRIRLSTAGARRGEAGMSVVELVVVVVIFAILTAIAIPVILSVQQHVRNTEAAAAAANAATQIAVEMAQQSQLSPRDVDTSRFTQHFDPPLALAVTGDPGEVGTICVRVLSGGGVDEAHLAGGADEITAGPCSVGN